jgi:hypothetical protein
MHALHTWRWPLLLQAGKQKAFLQACFPEGDPVDQAALQGLQEHISDKDLREASARLARLLSLEEPEQQVQVRLPCCPAAYGYTRLGSRPLTLSHSMQRTWGWH